jgi:copper chaperone NosL
MKRILMVSIVLFALSSCSKDPQPIQYGFDSCAYCVMQISDARFGTEIVTKKGKVYKFDSIECMIDMVREGKLDSEAVHQYHVTLFDQPGALVPAVGTQILRSEAIPSPMLRNLSAFDSPETANYHLGENNGDLLPWDKAKTDF